MKLSPNELAQNIEVFDIVIECVGFKQVSLLKKEIRINGANYQIKKYIQGEGS